MSQENSLSIPATMDPPSSPVSLSKEPQDIRDKYGSLKRRFMELEPHPHIYQRYHHLRYLSHLMDKMEQSLLPDFNRQRRLHRLRPGELLARRLAKMELPGLHPMRLTRRHDQQGVLRPVCLEMRPYGVTLANTANFAERGDIVLNQRDDRIDGDSLANGANEATLGPQMVWAPSLGRRIQKAGHCCQALAALLSATTSHMQIDPMLMENHGVKNTADVTSRESLTEECANQVSSDPPASLPSHSTSLIPSIKTSSNQQEATTSNQTASTSPATSSPSSATPSSSINPYAFLYGAMSPLSAVPTTPSSATPLTPSFPYPNLYYPYPIAMPPGMFVPPPGFVPPAPSQEPQQRPPPDPPRATKPKRLKAHTVTTKSFSIPTVPRDKSGKPMLPLNVGIMTVISLGEVCMREHFHTERYIFPVGYEVTRCVAQGSWMGISTDFYSRYLSTIDPLHEVVYHCTILDGGDGRSSK
ncbi:Transforming growth factor beta regulator [Salix suchowensis]|nr:Transforming growth factor beta regulator [Salix suchowensis]